MITFFWLWAVGSTLALLAIVVYQAHLTRLALVPAYAYIRLIRSGDECLSIGEAAAACVLRGDFAGAAWLIRVLALAQREPAVNKEPEVEMYWATVPGLRKGTRLTAADYRLLSTAALPEQQVLAIEIIIGRHEYRSYTCPNVSDMSSAIKKARAYLREQSEAVQAVLGCVEYRSGATALAV